MNKYHSLIPIVFAIGFIGFYFNDTSESWQKQVSGLCQDDTGKYTLDQIIQCNNHNKEMFWYVILYQSGIVTGIFSPIWIAVVMPYLKERNGK